MLSRTSGNVFEKRLLESYIAEHGKDPTNGEELSTDDIVDIKISKTVRPRPPTATSIPSLLSIFQNEWDALALETYQIRQQLYQTRQELSTALYQNDAACRVIARITKERDEPRDALSKVSENLNGAASHDVMDTDVKDTKIPQEVQDIASATLEKESATRKKRKVPDDWTTATDLANLKHGRNRKADSELFEDAANGASQQITAQHPSATLLAASNRDVHWSIKRVADDETLATIENPAGMMILTTNSWTTLTTTSGYLSRIPSGRSSRRSWSRGRQRIHFPSTHRSGGSDFRTRTRPN